MYFVGLVVWTHQVFWVIWCDEDREEECKDKWLSTPITLQKVRGARKKGDPWDVVQLCSCLLLPARSPSRPTLAPAPSPGGRPRRLKSSGHIYTHSKCWNQHILKPQVAKCLMAYQLGRLGSRVLGKAFGWAYFFRWGLGVMAR